VSILEPPSSVDEATPLHPGSGSGGHHLLSGRVPFGWLVDVVTMPAPMLFGRWASLSLAPLSSDSPVFGDALDRGRRLSLDQADAQSREATNT
jgi:hypothetical protein